MNALKSQPDAGNHLDRVVPLDGASHDEVARYSVETTWRKAECIATLTDGRRVKLRDSWQFVGYTGRDSVRSLLFCHEGVHLEVQIDADHRDGRFLPARMSDFQVGGSTFTALDGSLITVTGHCLTVLRSVYRSKFRLRRSTDSSPVTAVPATV